ncbi:MAG: FAD-binding protein [Clostridia bacterium]|nr:FAD-binding protein [Clostridia bacterium]
MKEIVTRTAVVGSGCAGLNAADWLASLGEDCLLITENMLSGTSRNTGSDKQTYYKLSLSGDDGDSVGEMARTLKREDVDGDLALCEAAGSAPCFLKLAGLGVPFPQNDYGEYVGYQTDHDVRKRASSAGPLTSRMMTEALQRSVLARGVHVLDHTLACRILTGESGVCGLLCLNMQKREWLQIRCAHVVLCTGGPAAIYHSRVYPASQFGMSGMAFEAGAEGENLDCWQYGLASVKFRWNVSGSYQQALPRYVSVDADGVEHDFLTEALGEREALLSVFLKGYQWPYDPRKAEGSSRVDILVKRENDLGRRVYMDFRRSPTGFSAQNLGEEAREYLINCGATQAAPIERLRAINAPAIALYRDHHIDLETEMLEVRVCAQHHNGGLAVDENWQTCVEGLYACGEAAGTFGAYRPGGTALNSTQVGSMRAAQHIARRSARRIPEAARTAQIPEAPAGNVSELTLSLQKAMSRHAAFIRDEAGIRRLLSDLEAAGASCAPVSAQDPLAAQRLRLQDMMITQRHVLGAMLYGLAHEGEGVLMTRGGESYRRPARPIPERDQWFERVWKAYREQRTRA